MKDEKTGVRCVIPGCSGEIVERFKIPYIPAEPGGENLFGFGSFNVATEKDGISNGYHCDKCGIKYLHLPKN